MNFLLYTLPLIAAVTGWITNYIAVKMLFHPRKPISLGLFTVQGIFPKRQAKLAQQLGELVARELLSAEDLKQMLSDPSMMEGTEEVIGGKIDVFVKNFIASKPMLAMFVSSDFKAQIKESILAEIRDAMPELMEMFMNKMEQTIDIKKAVADKIANFSTNKIEDMLYSIMSKEFHFIEILGGVLGFIIGLIQLAIVLAQN